jgi:ubiquitin carboxyl-terminal hydrolase 9/24
VVWKSAVESLQAAERFLTVSEDARFFVEKYMQQIISILVEQVPSKIGSHERSCVQESLRLATTIIAKDLEIQLRRRGQSTLLEVVTLVFNRKKNFYKGNKGNWNNHMSGLPEVRMGVIDLFLQVKGFALLHTYMSERIGSPAFPDLDILHQVLTALGDIVPVRCNTPEQAAAARETEDAAIFVGRATMQFVNSCSGEKLKKIPVELLQTLQKDLSRIFDRLISSRRESTYEYYEFWRGLILRLIKSPSLPLRLFGWQQMDDLLDACAEHRPPPRFFDVSTAGCTFVNGRYSYIASTTSDGYAQNGIDISYQRHIPENEKDGGGKKLTLFRCTMRSQQKWWFLSEADEEQPGTDRDIDYYQHKSKEHDEAVPPGDGWITCRNAGLDPSPQLQSHGLMVPPGQEYNTLEHQLAEWAVRNDIVQIVLGDSVHREIVARSTALIKFLASMCHRDDGVDSTSGKSPNQYCLQVTDLLLAWKTCSRKTDAAVSVQIYQLLVSILPECPSALAIPLLEAVQATLYQGKDRVEYLTEVADFCAALAAANSSDAKAASTIDLDDDVRREVLEVLWSVLTHPDAASLKVYDTLKQYVTNELRVEPRGSEHRERYLAACVRTLTENSMIASGTFVDEAQALRIVKLTHFVLAACPRAQAAKLVNEDSGTLPALLFGELTSCLKRLRIMDSVKKVRL